MPVSPIPVTDNQELSQFLDRAISRKILALDTEFVWTRTYYPALGLIQAATSEEDVILIDPLACTNLPELGDVIGDPDITTILHDASGDLPILHRACGFCEPRGIFDTRMAAGFCGRPSTLSLGNLLNDLLDIDLPKTESRTDWLKRPLSEEQLEYAADDVRHLPEMYRVLADACAAAETLPWLQEELQGFEKPDVWLDYPTEEAFLRIKGMGRLAPKQRAVLRELAAWREEIARDEDRTRKHVCTDGLLLHLAKTCPSSMDALRAVKSLSKKQLKRSGEDILSAIKRGLDTPDDACPRLSSVNAVNHKWVKKQADCVLAHAKDICTGRGIDPILAVTRRDASSLVTATAHGTWEAHLLFQGWRGELLREPLTPVLRDIAADSPA